MRRFVTSLIIVLIINLTASAITMKLTVDATELSRKLLHSRTEFESLDRTVGLLYPKWIPGIHYHGGPIKNIGTLLTYDTNGDRLEWERDWTNHFRFLIDSTRTTDGLTVDMTYICNQPTTNSKGIDSYGSLDIGVINWNTVVLYPENVSVADIDVELRLILPSGWSFGTALPFDRRQDDTLAFKTVTLEELIDMPLICGRYARSIEIAETDLATYYLDVVADAEEDLPNDGDSTLMPLEQMVEEAEAMFGGVHFDEYHLLLTLSDVIPGNGLEHRNSSLNGVKSSEFRKNSWNGKRIPYLLPHEFAHAWCGKYRRPAGMYTDDYQDDKDTDLLWVYEGMTQYLGRVLTYRSGFYDSTVFVENIALQISRQQMQKGRTWRSLRDTEVAAGMLRESSPSWAYLRRDQDYYDEGAMHWMEFDAMIRNGTEGAKSLDDFCRAFFNKDDKGAFAIPFDLAEIVATLNEVYPAPWDSLIDVRVYHPVYTLALDIVDRLGMRLDYTDKKPKAISQRESQYGSINCYESLGLGIGRTGKINDVRPDSPADKAGLVPATQIVAVNGKKFSKQRFEDALIGTTEGLNVRLLVLHDESYNEYEIDYDGGPRYLELTPLNEGKNMLYDIARPLIRTDKDQ